MLRIISIVREHSCTAVHYFMTSDGKTASLICKFISSYYQEDYKEIGIWDFVLSPLELFILMIPTVSHQHCTFASPPVDGLLLRLMPHMGIVKSLDDACSHSLSWCICCIHLLLKVWWEWGSRAVEQPSATVLQHCFLCHISWEESVAELPVPYPWSDRKL